MPDSIAAPFVVPSRIGPFRIITQLGEGGFAPVYLAAEEYGGVELRIVALKVFLTGQPGQQTPSSTATIGASLFDQVLSEARALSRVEHPNIVRFYQILEDRQRGLVGLAMEHVRGEPLSNRLDAINILSVPDALAIGATLASALAAVHAAGLVHRDVKPGNVIETNGTVKLIDFGIATRRRADPTKGTAAAIPRGSGNTAPISSSFVPASLPASAAVIHPADQEDRTLALAPRVVTTKMLSQAQIQGAGFTSRREPVPGSQALPPYLPATVTIENDTGEMIAGTMGYIDPACLGKGEAPDASSDLYALGAMLFECLAGRVPAGLDEKSSMLHSGIVLGIDRPPPLRSLAPHVPEGVAALVDSLIDPDRSKRPRHAEAVSAELARLRRGVLGKRRRLPEEGPFRGLDAFDERHRDVFFGRSAEITLALDALRSRGLVALVGPSGSGKSSLARAGVVPAVVDGDLGGWPKTYAAVAFQPGADPRGTIDRAFAPFLGTTPAMSLTPEACVRALAARVEQTEQGIVILVDALEELVTLESLRGVGGSWLAELIACLGRSPVLGVRAIVTARRDFLDALLEHPALGPAIARSVELVAPLSSRAFAEALEERLAAYGYSLEDASMRDELAAALASAPEAMPLFEFALTRLWDEADHVHRKVGRAALARIGGIGGALEAHAEQTLRKLMAELGPRVAEDATRALLIALTTPSGTRARRTMDELARETKLAPTGTSSPDRMLLTSILGALGNARLVVSEEGRFTLAHESLLQQWPRLRDWLVASRHRRELVHEVTQAAERWKKQGSERAMLLRGRVLRDAYEVVSDVDEPTRAFVEASRRAEKRNITGIVVLISVLFVGLIVPFGIYQVLEAQAREKERIAQEFADTLRATKQTPETARAEAIQVLLEQKHACEKRLAQCTSTTGADLFEDGGAGLGDGGVEAAVGSEPPVTE